MARLTDLARRRSNFTTPGTDISTVEQLDLIGVTLIARTADGPVDVPELALFFDKSGMTVRRPDRSRVVTIPWGNLVSASAVAEPGAELGMAALGELEIQSDRKQHRFVVPVAEPKALSRSLDLLSTRYNGREIMTEARPQRRGRRS